MQFLSGKFLGNSLENWLIAAGVAIGLLVVVRLVKSILMHHFFKLDHDRQDSLYAVSATLIKRLSIPVVGLLALYLAFLGLEVSQNLRTWFSALGVVAIIVQVTIWGNVLITYALQRYQNANGAPGGERVTTLRALGFVGRLALISVASLVALDNIPGVKVTTLIASLGIGGIAVALAVQNILSDLFASLSIVLDKPFVIGDFIIVDTHLGTVEYIGLKTTRIRSLSGEQLVFSNSDLLNSRIRNYKRMAERRVVFTIGVLYQTDYAKIIRIPQIIRRAIEAQADTRFDRSHFQGYGDSSLNFETVYYVLAADYNLYMDIQQAINLEIFRQFEAEGISFAYPTRTLHLYSASAAPSILTQPADRKLEVPDPQET